jgi:hypothetical protein
VPSFTVMVLPIRSATVVMGMFSFSHTLCDWDRYAHHGIECFSSTTLTRARTTTVYTDPAYAALLGGHVVDIAPTTR